METATQRRQLNVTQIRRVRELREINASAMIASDRALAGVLKVERVTIINWREAGIIRGKKNQHIWIYNLKQVLNDLAKYIDNK